MDKPSGDKPEPGLENEAAIEIMAEMVMWVRERPGWIMKAAKSDPIPPLPPKPPQN
jgi:hypothetical protein